MIRKSTYISGIWIVLCGILISRAIAEPVPGCDADKLLSNATHVAVVRVSAFERTTDRHEGSFAATVVRRISGDGLPDTITVTLRRDYQPFVVPVVRQGSHLLGFFVKSSKRGGWRLSDPYYGLILVSDARPGFRPAQNAREAVLNELRSSLNSREENVVASALKALAAFGDTSAFDRARTLVAGGRAGLASRALVYLLHVGEGNVRLADVVRLVESPEVATREKEELAWSLLKQEGRIPLGQLNALLLRPTYSTLRTVVATILSRRGDSSSVPALVVGLSDPNAETQYRCVVGLSRITDRPAPGYNDFMRNPAPALAEWQTWWESRVKGNNP